VAQPGPSEYDRDMELVFVAIVGLVLIAMISSGVTAGGRGLQRKFQSLGTLKGRTEAEIVAVVGPPTSRGALPNGKRLLQWQRPGYHVALGFEANGVCYGVTHEFVHRR
jgi:hypothetical protein